MCLQWQMEQQSLAAWAGGTIDLKRITRSNLGIARVGHFWKCYGSEASES
jgi:hypothetical protein